MTAQQWFIDADLGFPAKAAELWIEASTATGFDPLTFEVTAIPPDHFEEIRREYDAIASAHAKVCKYKEANRWLRAHPEQTH